ncbi:hypothetical protein HB779_03120 [Phyllobacterium sp. 628]|uniref:hypothetical protein n=1 Tax=Phyllobacterium sp. 628 TaxID=2718938 RepID=UPI0016622B00|nr:hypothetical protein [Phyllobacterium sp. 628]QND50990.1 hypothetical protein HB779_03120 [Phyllobacterium sp. 628]
MTDGSGGMEKSRTHFSRQIIEDSGSLSGAVFGSIPDKVWYRSLQEKNFTFFHSILAEIERDLTEYEHYQIVADAVDGYNPIHDLAAAMGTALQKRLINRKKRAELYFSAAVPGVLGERHAEFWLDDEAKARKNRAVQNYTPLAEEARRILDQDKTALDRETIIHQVFDWSFPHCPQWETIGRDRVAAGVYPSCLTFRDHLQPVVLDLLGSP